MKGPKKLSEMAVPMLFTIMQLACQVGEADLFTLLDDKSVEVTARLYVMFYSCVSYKI